MDHACNGQVKRCAAGRGARGWADGSRVSRRSYRVDIADPVSDTRAFFQSFKELEAHRPDFDRIQLASALGAALEKEGHIRLARAESEPGSFVLSGLFVPVMFWGLGSSAGIALDVAPLYWPLLSLLLAVVYGALVTAAPNAAGPAAVLLIIAWFGVGVAFGIADPGSLTWTYAIPIAAWLGIAFLLRTLRLREARDVALALAGVARSAPYVAPVVLVAVLLPALTADVWQLAAEVEPENLIAAGVLSVGVLLLLLARQLRRELEPALAARCRALVARVEVPEATRMALAAAVDRDTARIISELPANALNDAWPSSGEEYAPYLAAVEGHALRQPLLARLLITAGVVGALLASYIYALLAVTVPRSVASDWSGSTVRPIHVSLFGVDPHLPGDVYIAMALLLGVFATAIFLAFALTEERIAAALTEALLREPLDRFLMLALPFVSLLEWGLEYQQSLQSEPGEVSYAVESASSGAGEPSK